MGMQESHLLNKLYSQACSLRQASPSLGRLQKLPPYHDAKYAAFTVRLQRAPGICLQLSLSDDFKPHLKGPEQNKSLQ